MSIRLTDQEVLNTFITANHGLYLGARVPDDQQNYLKVSGLPTTVTDLCQKQRLHIILTKSLQRSRSPVIIYSENRINNFCLRT